MSLKIKIICFFSFLGIIGGSAQENLVELGELPDLVSETSGLLFYKGKLITHNDSGNMPQLYEIDTVSLEITRTVTIANATNIDWEDIAQDDTYIYIGDFGNFNGDRRDLTIYRILKNTYDAMNLVTADRIDFSYSDQINFNSTTNSDWDAEALFVHNNRLVVLTKQWQRNATTAYIIPNEPGEVVAERLDSYESEGLVTGATFDISSNTLFLTGYTPQLLGFLLRIEGLANDAIFEGTVEKIDLNLNFLQVEAIAAVGNGSYFLSSEFFSNAAFSITSPARLFRFGIIEEEETPPMENEGQLLIFKPFGSQELEYELQIPTEIRARAIFDSNGRMVQFALPDQIEGNRIDISTLNSAIYYLTFYFNGGIVSRGFIRN